MKIASIKELKDELKYKEKEELVQLCLSLAKFKKESKELLTYLMFEVSDEGAFIEGVKEEITDSFSEVNASNIYFLKKSARKVLRVTKKYIRYSKQKQTEAELLLHYCQELKGFSSSLNRSVQLKNLFNQQLGLAQKAIGVLHEDLQYDYQMVLDNLVSGT